MSDQSGQLEQDDVPIAQLEQMLTMMYGRCVGHIIECATCDGATVCEKLVELVLAKFRMELRVQGRKSEEAFKQLGEHP